MALLGPTPERPMALSPHVRLPSVAVILALAIPALAIPTTASAETFPADSDWTPVLRDGAVLSDPCDDVAGSDWWDLVGTADLPAAYTAFDGTNLWFRLRLRASPYRATGSSRSWRSFGWGVMLETDWTTTGSYDDMVFVDGTSDSVFLAENTTASTPFYSDVAELTIGTYDAPAAPSGDASAGYAGYTLAGSDICGGTTGSVDSFVDWAVPWADIEASTGLTTPTDLAFAFGTSASTRAFSKDIAGCTGTSGCDWWESLSDSSRDSDGDGLTDQDEVDIYGTDPWVADTDADGLTDGEEVLVYITDPLDDDTDDDRLTDGDEVLVYGTDPLAMDTDEGGVPDGDEVDRGTDPLDPSDDYSDPGGGDTGGGDTGTTGDGGGTADTGTTGDGGGTADTGTTGDGGTSDTGVSTDGGAADGGADTGTADTGTSDGGAADGGSADGGTTDTGVSADGGASDGGAADLINGAGAVLGGACAGCSSGGSRSGGGLAGAMSLLVLGLAGRRRRDRRG